MTRGQAVAAALQDYDEQTPAPYTGPAEGLLLSRAAAGHLAAYVSGLRIALSAALEGKARAEAAADRARGVVERLEGELKKKRRRKG